MSDTTTQAVPSFQIQRVYLKGQSLEIPHAPAIFLEQGEMKLDLHLSPTVQTLEGTISEVTLRATVTAKIGEKVAYVLEVDQAGIFDVQNLSAQDTMQALEVKGSEILASYLRAAVSDTLSRSSLPAFILPEINWLVAYQQRIASTTPASQTIQ